MTFLEQVSFDLVVARWLKAELSSPRFRPRVLKALKRLNLPPRALERPILTSRRENLLRREALHLHRQDISGTFPRDTRWWRAAITRQLFRRLRVINYPTWTLLSRDTGLLSEAADTVARGEIPPKARGRWAQEAHAVTSNVLEIQDRMNWAGNEAQLILMGRPKGKTWTILEGNKRATALYIRCFLAKTGPFPRSLEVLVGLTAQPFPPLRVA
ncbi:MAG: hypothetical protein ACE5G5_10615 [Candidatus Methylomirabilales bacterium]